MEKYLVDKCKIESQNNAHKIKEDRVQAILKLKDFDILTPDKKRRQKAREIAEKLAKDIDLEEVFKEIPKKKLNQEDS